ncbi:mycofactocin system transcriptional regulator [Microbacterium sediminis]|uniref:Mycofactocin system transcriptional regulator n=1 Tax=Microbacterium sediminis TaxID=904291 RepID=A0A1B9NIE6_9MICO|nr:mycofactocin system transcriptional regulator [Microbacterium sediminis]OCG76355.1 mycofactocin system transcriptional regulator [Microbacterium sediminis]
MTPDVAVAARPGRAPVTSAAELGRVGLELILDRGFDAVTVDDIAAAAGIGRRTFFRYFSSKNDLPWGDFNALLTRMRAHLAEVPRSVPLAEALRDAVVEFNRFPDDEMPQHRKRMAVLLETPTLVAHSALRYEEWRRVVAEFAADRLGIAPTSLVANATGRACLAITLAAYEHWLRDEDAVLTDLIRGGFVELARVFGAPEYGGAER